MEYGQGDVIGGRYEVVKVLGRGGFGIVYLVTARHDGGVYALKTFLPTAGDKKSIDRFRQESQVWIALGGHPYVVQAYFIDELENRLFVGMEYVAPGDTGLNALDAFLKNRPPDLAQSLRWGVQICLGMEYARTRGIRSHRDLKPANLMISPELDVKITDFGLATHPGSFPDEAGSQDEKTQSAKAFRGQTMRGIGFGTPTHMPPEQFEDAAACDVRSDIYSVGVILYQMVTRGSLPVTVPWPEENTLEARLGFWRDMESAHKKLSLLSTGSALDPIIRKCIVADPEGRYQTFADLRADLGERLRHETGEVIPVPAKSEMTAGAWLNKGLSLQYLKRFDEAIQCYDQALQLSPGNTRALNNRGISLMRARRYDEALQNLEEALRTEPRNTKALTNKATCLQSLGRLDEALILYGQALGLDRSHTAAWTNRGNILFRTGRYEEAVSDYDHALLLNPDHPGALNNKGLALMRLMRFIEAVEAFDGALGQDPHFSTAWRGKAVSLVRSGDMTGARAALKQVGNLNADNVDTWIARSVVAGLGERYQDALSSLDEAVEIGGSDPRIQMHRANMLLEMNRAQEASGIFDQVLKTDPNNEIALHNRGLSHHILGDFDSALRNYDKTLARTGDSVTAFNRACTLARAGRGQDAVTALAAVVEQVTYPGAAHFNMGNLLLYVRQSEDAVRSYDSALAFLPNCTDAWYNKGVALLELERWEESLQAFNMAYHVDLHHTEFWSAGGQETRATGLPEVTILRDELPPFGLKHTLQEQRYRLGHRLGNSHPRPLYLLKMTIW